MNLDDFSEQIFALLGLEDSSWDADDNLFETIGLDSFQAFELLVIVESLAGAETSPLNMPSIQTVRDAYSY